MNLQLTKDRNQQQKICISKQDTLTFGLYQTELADVNYTGLDKKQNKLQNIMWELLLMEQPVVGQFAEKATERTTERATSGGK